MLSTARANVLLLAGWTIACAVRCGGGSPTSPGSGGPVPSPSGQVCGISFGSGQMSRDIGSAAGTLTITVPASSGCRWSATKDADFLEVEGPSERTGPADIVVNVGRNTRGERTGRVILTDPTSRIEIAIRQAAAACVLTISGDINRTFPAAGGRGDVAITMPEGSGCPWSADGAPPWITITSGSSGAGDGMVSYTVGENRDTSNRTGALAVAGNQVTVTQLGRSTAGSSTAPVIAVQPQSQAIPAGTSATLSVTAQSLSPLTYQWYEGARGATTRPVNGTDSSFNTPILTINATYWVRVFNSAGFTDSDAAQVTLQTPQITADLSFGTTVTLFGFSGSRFAPNKRIDIRVNVDLNGTEYVAAGGVTTDSGGNLSGLTYGIGSANDPRTVLGGRQVVASFCAVGTCSTGDVVRSNSTRINITSRCDVNRDSRIDQTDVNVVQQAVLNGSFNSAYDMNRDGQVNVGDVQILVNVFQSSATCPE